MIPDIVAGVELVLEAETARREENEERERRHAEMQRRRQLAAARADREQKRLDYLNHILAMRDEAVKIKAWLVSAPQDVSLANAGEYKRMLTWAKKRLEQLEVETGPKAIAESLKGASLFPETDDLFDPLGEPPTKYDWWS